MVTTVALLLGLTAVRAGLSRAEIKHAERATQLRAVGETLEIVIIAVSVIFLVVRPFIAQVFFIPSHSMAPTLQVNDRLIVNKLAYRFGAPQRNDVVVFRAPARATRGVDEPDDQDYVKRVIGIAGDTVEVRSGMTYVNGSPIRVPVAAAPPAYDLAPFVVPPGTVFVLGDNRNNSNDSHRWGALETGHLIGKATIVFWPPSRCGLVR